jgi:hypothetical protein
MPIVLNEQEKCPICATRFKQSVFDSEDQLRIYIPDGGSGLSESCYHLLHYQCIKTWYDVKQKFQEETSEDDGGVWLWG